MTPLEEALADMRYANSLGETALKQHYLIWRGATIPIGSSDIEYVRAVMEIWDKLNTPECLLEK